VDRHLGDDSKGADLIWEFYVPRGELIAFFEEARRALLKSETPLIYGTVRFIEQDRDSFLAWAKKRYACVIFTPHYRAAQPEFAEPANCIANWRRLPQAWRKLLSHLQPFRRAERYGRCLSTVSEFLQLNGSMIDELFQSDWYRHYRDLYA